MNAQHAEAYNITSEGSRRLWIALAIVVIVMVAEVIGGFLSDSLALVGDAGHMLVDALALGLSLFAIRLARKPATANRTYGYHRAEIMAALANGAILALVSVYVFYEAVQRLASPVPVRTPLMLVVASIGLVANIAGVLLLRKVEKENLNIKGAFWHILGDTISSVGVVVAGVIITFTGWYIVDPIMAIIIGGVILWGAVWLVRQSANILLEAVPEHIKVDSVIEAIRIIPGIGDLHDIHIWTITSGIYAFSAHLIIADQMVSHSAEIMEAVRQRLAQQFNITHTTLQVECERCESCPGGLVCQMSRPEEKPDQVE